MKDNVSFTVAAQRQYRKVYQGTTYSLSWTDATGPRSKVFKNYQTMMRFVSNDFQDPKRAW